MKVRLKKGLPKYGELVVCTVKRVTPFAAWVRLDEYPELEGMIHVSEVAGKIVRDIRNYIKEGKMYIAKVIRVDKKKGMVDLSLKRVAPYEKKEKMNEFKLEKRALAIIVQAGKKLKKNEEEIKDFIENVLLENFSKLDAFLKKIIDNPEKLKDLKIGQNWIDAIYEIITKSIKEKEFTLKIDLILQSYDWNGIEKIKEILSEIEKRTNGKIKYISAPLYRLEVKTTDARKESTKIKKILEGYSKIGLEYRFLE
jgi:translation initiation factor 2 subunit 1